MSAACFRLGALCVALALPAATRAERPADAVLVVKSARTLQLLRDGEVLETFRVSLGPNPDGHKQQEGDGRTPEGHYVLDWKNPNSAFHRSLHVSYPDASDRADALRRGVDPGGMIMVHGQRNGFGWLAPVAQRVDWTDGCIAVSDAEMDRIWELVEPGTPIEIRP